MSYEFPPQEPKPQDPKPQVPARKGGGGCLILLIIGVVGFFLISRAMPRPEPGARPQQPNVERDSGSDNRSTGSDESSGSVFDQSSAKKSEHRGDQGEAKKTTKGEWSVEEVQTNSGGDTNLKVSPKSNQKGPESRKTTKGEWSIEEAETDTSGKPASSSPKLSTPAQPKTNKTKKGDWELETD